MRRGVLLLLLAGCGHAEPFTSRVTPPSGPFAATPPIRLTFNVGEDSWAAWSPDATRLLYSAQDSFSSDKDRCIAQVPAQGGPRTLVACPPNFFPNDTTEVYDQPAPNGAVIAFMSQALGVDEHAPFRHTLWLVGDSAGAVPRPLQQFPYVAPTGHPHDAALFLQWLRPNVLLYLGAENGCCRKDTLRFGEEVTLLDLSGPAPVRSFVPNTLRASAVSAERDGNSIYYTFYGDSIVYRQSLSDNSVTVIHNFGAGHIVRDPQVANNRLLAVVDGVPGFRDAPPFFGIAVDYGGVLHLVDLGTGDDTVLPTNGLLYKHPVFSPSGQRFVVEGYPFTATPIPGTTAVDTVVSKWADLWLWEE
jgi:hypothetical protein